MGPPVCNRGPATPRHSPRAFGGNLMSLPRPLREEERRLVRWMIEHGDPAPHQHLSQLEQAMVVGECPCGCASIDFQIGHAPPNFKAGMEILADYLYSRGDESFGAFIFACEGCSEVLRSTRSQIGLLLYQHPKICDGWRGLAPNQALHRMAAPRGALAIRDLRRGRHR
jgi:hypothetical protein